MNTQEEITRRQNDEGMLKCQYAARKYYNCAEIACYISWILALIGAVIIIVPNSVGVGLLVIPVIIDIITLILQHLVEQNVKNGAKMRNFFDARVLGICNSYSSSEERDIWEKANTMVNADKDTFSYQCTHSGKDTPPGLKDWYVFTKTYSTPEDAVFECQKQNFWWTDKMYKSRIIFYIIIGAVLFNIANIGFHYSPLKTVLCLISIAVNLSADILGSIHCSRVMQSIKTITELQNAAINQYVIEDLQKLIKERREIQLLEINRIHSKNAPKWSILYETITSDNNDDP